MKVSLSLDPVLLEQASGLERQMEVVEAPVHSHEAWRAKNVKKIMPS